MFRIVYAQSGSGCGGSGGGGKGTGKASNPKLGGTTKASTRLGGTTKSKNVTPLRAVKKTKAPTK